MTGHLSQLQSGSCDQIALAAVQHCIRTGEPPLLRRTELQTVGKRDLLEDGLDIMIPIGATTENPQAKIDLGGGRQSKAFFS